MKSLILPSELAQQIRRHCEAAYPHEACGLLIGTRLGGVIEVIPSENLSETPEKAFEIDPALIIKYQKKARAGHNQLIGHYHSHPDGEAEPSPRDQQQSYDPDLTWVIVEVRAGTALGMRAFAADNKTGYLKAVSI